MDFWLQHRIWWDILYYKHNELKLLPSLPLQIKGGVGILIGIKNTYQVCLFGFLRELFLWFCTYVEHSCERSLCFSFSPHLPLPISTLSHPTPNCPEKYDRQFSLGLPLSRGEFKKGCGFPEAYQIVCHLKRETGRKPRSILRTCYKKSDHQMEGIQLSFMTLITYIKLLFKNR